MSPVISLMDKSVTKISAIFMLLVAVLSGCFAAQESAAKSTAQPNPKTKPALMSDAAIAARVAGKLSKTSSLESAYISVDVKGGVVSLTGRVNNAHLKEVATRVARSIEGVKKVNNKLRLNTRCCAGPRRRDND